MVLRDAAGLVVDSLNYGGLVDPWAAEGYQATSGPEAERLLRACTGRSPRLRAPWRHQRERGPLPGRRSTPTATAPISSRRPLLAFPPVRPPARPISKSPAWKASTLARRSRSIPARTSRPPLSRRLARQVVPPFATATDVGAIVIPVASAAGFRDGQTITIDSGANSETAVVASVRRFGPPAITVTAPLVHAHTSGVQVSGTGITLTAALTRAHAAGAPVSDNVPTPGAPNHYSRRAR